MMTTAITKTMHVLAECVPCLAHRIAIIYYDCHCGWRVCRTSHITSIRQNVKQKFCYNAYMCAYTMPSPKSKQKNRAMAFVFICC